MALTQDVGQKRKRFAAIDITPSRNNGNGDGDSNELTAVVRKWGSAFTVFEDTDRDTPLWQLQVCHGGRNSFGYQVLAVAREALQKHPNSSVRDLQQWSRSSRCASSTEHRRKAVHWIRMEQGWKRGKSSCTRLPSRMPWSSYSWY